MKARIIRSTIATGLFSFAMLASAPVLAAACALTADDFASLQLSRSGVKDQAQADALPEDRQKALCRTRASWNRIQSAKFEDADLTKVSVYYLSPTEAAAFSKVQSAYMQARLKNMSDQEWQQFRQKLIDDVKRK
jgi:hypothetical protein